MKEVDEDGWGKFFGDPGIMVILLIIGMVIYGLIHYIK